MKDTKIDVDWEISEFDPKDLSDDETKEFYEFYLDKQKESAPVLPCSNFETYKRDFIYDHPTDFNFKFKVNDGSNLIATANVSVIKPSATAPQADKLKSWMSIHVKKEWRRKEIGSVLLKKLLEKIEEFKIEKAFIYSSLEPGKVFCTSFGGEITDSSYYNYLNLKTINWEKIEGLNKALSGRTPEISIRVTNGLKSEDRNIYLDLLVALMEEISKYSSEWDFDEDFFRSEYLVDEKRQIAMGEVSIIAYAKSSDGTVVGMSVLVYDPAKPEEIYTDISGTVKDFRGMGLCKRMKTELLLFLKNNLPDISVVTTSNDEENSVMRAINNQLGFESLPISYGYSFKFDELKKKLQSV
ncbi:MAG: GNAT family N-acetyltransferase [Caldisericia bacterium]|nr:GNAT family N-acetyltransferase [Caldisericia bacterium]